MNYEFDKEMISQHVVKYGVHLHPAVLLKHEKTKLQDYCNWLIEQAPEAFETLLSGPNQLRLQKNFVLSGNRRVDMPTFILTARGPLLAAGPGSAPLPAAPGTSLFHRHNPCLLPASESACGKPRRAPAPIPAR